MDHVIQWPAEMSQSGLGICQRRSVFGNRNMLFYWSFDEKFNAISLTPCKTSWHLMTSTQQQSTCKNIEPFDYIITFIVTDLAIRSVCNSHYSSSLCRRVQRPLTMWCNNHTASRHNATSRQNDMTQCHDNAMTSFQDNVTTERPRSITHNREQCSVKSVSDD